MTTFPGKSHGIIRRVSGKMSGNIIRFMKKHKVPVTRLVMPVIFQHLTTDQRVKLACIQNFLRPLLHVKFLSKVNVCKKLSDVNCPFSKANHFRTGPREMCTLAVA